MKKIAYLIALVVATVSLTAAAHASEATFERTLVVNGHVELSVATGSGNIHLIHGSDNRIHIFGRVKSSGWGSSNQNVQEIAAHPPIEQTGNIIRIGQHHNEWHNVSIDYEIEAPADALLSASSGSGDLNIDGVGQDARLSSGSGNIHAKGLRGGFSVSTGSGDIVAEQSTPGDVKASTGSGNIELRNIRGGLRTSTGSGDTRVGGAPSAPWHVETGSGNVEFWSSGSSFTLDASTGSGNVHNDREMLVQGSNDKHHIVGKVGGGGPTVRLSTGSGNISIH